MLLLRGARQVGKTSVCRQLGQSFKKGFVEINLVDQPLVAKLFADSTLSIDQLISSIAAFAGQPIVDGETLLFIDEIQASKEAIARLRFLHEKRPHLHVIATGSLLEFALEDVESFGVGRVEYLFMHPLTFEEVLIACKEEQLMALIRLMLNRLHSDLLVTYEDDFAKYRERVPQSRLRDTLRSVAFQAGKKFIYSHAYRDAASKEVHRALDLLIKAGLAHKIFHSSASSNAEVDYVLEIDRAKEEAAILVFEFRAKVSQFAE